jgi:hypothetical protein
MIPRDSARPILKHIALDENGANGTINCNVTTMESKQNREVRPFDLIYPDYASVMHSGDGLSIHVNPYFLAEQLVTVAKILGLKKNTGTVKLQFKATDPERHPVNIVGQNHSVEVTGMVMPLVKEEKK